MKLFQLCIIILLMPATNAVAQLSIDLEASYIFDIPYNSVRIPSKGGTRIDLAKDLNTENTFTYRVKINYAINERHIISALAAPLTIKSSGVINKDVVYSERVFAAGDKINATYKFNSYR